MSFDLAVWYPSERWSNEEAAQIYTRLCDGDHSGLAANTAIDAFYDDLTRTHPEIDDVPVDQLDDTDYCPWSVAHDRSNAHMIIAAVWRKAEYVKELVVGLARTHGLAVFDPQCAMIIYPDIWRSCVPE